MVVDVSGSWGSVSGYETGYHLYDPVHERWVGMNSYLTQQSAEDDLQFFRDRQAKGGRPDLDVTQFVVRKRTYGDGS